MLSLSETKYNKMKRYLLKLIAVIAISLAGSLSSQAQIVIKVRPGPPIVRARPVCPGPRHVWVAGNYAPRGNQYIYTDGYWAVPPPRHSHWVEGKWKHRRGGWMWIPGHWR